MFHPVMLVSEAESWTTGFIVVYQLVYVYNLAL